MKQPLLADKLLLHETQVPATVGACESPVTSMDVSVFAVPTCTSPESDGTVTWDRTIMVVVELLAGGERGLGYTYANRATAVVADETLRPLVVGQDPMNVSLLWTRMVHEVRNLGLEGVCSMAISAVDVALWDLKARLLGVPLVVLLGRVRDSVPVYGSGGFTSYSVRQLQDQLHGWVVDGMTRVKMKIGTDPLADTARLRAARTAIGNSTQLFVDANGAYHPRQALRVAERLTDHGVLWFEEPVDHHDLEGMRFVREHAPPALDITAGEYGYASALYFERLIDSVDILQADVTRCGGFTGFLKVAALCESHLLPLSSHCAPHLHLTVGCAAPPVCHLEYFYDHARIEESLFDGAEPPRGGTLRPDASRPGLGLVLKRTDAARFTI